MTFDPSILLQDLSPMAKPTLRHIWDDSACEVIVQGIPMWLDLLAVHSRLKESFRQTAPAVHVELREAALVRPESTQECKITFSKPLETSLVETTIHHALGKAYAQKGLLFDTRAIHMVLANF